MESPSSKVSSYASSGIKKKNQSLIRSQLQQNDQFAQFKSTLPPKRDPDFEDDSEYDEEEEEIIEQQHESNNNGDNTIITIDENQKINGTYQDESNCQATIEIIPQFSPADSADQLQNCELEAMARGSSKNSDSGYNSMAIDTVMSKAYPQPVNSLQPSSMQITNQPFLPQKIYYGPDGQPLRSILKPGSRNTAFTSPKKKRKRASNNNVQVVQSSTKSSTEEIKQQDMLDSQQNMAPLQTEEQIQAIMDSRPPRYDSKNNQIKWGQKQHKLTFADEVGKKDQKKPFAEVYVIESYKRFNRDIKENENGCCSIF